MKIIKDNYNNTILPGIFIHKTCWNCNSIFIIEYEDELCCENRKQIDGPQWEEHEAIVTYYTINCPCCGVKIDIRENTLAPEILKKLKWLKGSI